MEVGERLAQPPILSCSREAPAQQLPKQWRVGTLTYNRRGLLRLFAWLLWGDFAWSMRDRAIGPVFQLLLAKYHASDTVNALLLSVLPGAIGLFLGPIISFRSDRYRSRLGRRIPFLLVTTPIAALGMAALAFSPMFGTYFHHLLGRHSPGLTPSILIFFGCFWIMFEIAAIAAGSVFGALLNDVVPGPLLGRFFGLFRAVSLIAGMIFNFWLFKSAEDHYVWLFVAISALYGVCVLAMCFNVKEGRYPPPPDMPADRSRPFLQRLMDAARIYLRECYSKPYYLWVFLALAISNLAFMPVNLYSVRYALSLNISMQTYGYLLALTYAISLALSYFLGSMADRFHPLRVGIVALFLYTAACLWGGLAANATIPFVIAFVAHGVLSGTFFTATASLGQRLFPHEKFAQYASAGGILGSLINIAATFAFGLFLDYSGNVYRYTFLAGAVLGSVGLLLFVVILRQFKTYGGSINYVAPE